MFVEFHDQAIPLVDTHGGLNHGVEGDSTYYLVYICQREDVCDGVAVEPNGPEVFENSFHV